jgi:hypothetical protein
VCRSVVLKASARAVSCIYRLKEVDINYDMKPFSLSNNKFALLNAELNDEGLLKCLCLKSLMLLLEKLEIKHSA